MLKCFVLISFFHEFYKGREKGKRRRTRGTKVRARVVWNKYVRQLIKNTYELFATWFHEFPIPNQNIFHEWYCFDKRISKQNAF